MASNPPKPPGRGQLPQVQPALPQRRWADIASRPAKPEPAPEVPAVANPPPSDGDSTSVDHTSPQVNSHVPTLSTTTHSTQGSTALHPQPSTQAHTPGQATTPLPVDSAAPINAHAPANPTGGAKPPVQASTIRQNAPRNTARPLPRPPKVTGAIRVNGHVLTNHFEIRAGNVQNLYEYPMNIVQTNPQPPHNRPPPRRVRRRVIYLLIQQLLHGPINPPAPPTPPGPPANPPNPDPNPPTGSSDPPKSTPTVETTESSATADSTPSRDPPASDKGEDQLEGEDEPTQSDDGSTQGGSDTVQRLLANMGIASDYQDYLVTTTQIPLIYWQGVPHQVAFYEDWSTGPVANPQTFTVTITGETILNIAQMRAYMANPAPWILQGVNTFAGQRDSTLRALNILFSNHANLCTFDDRPGNYAQTTAGIGSKKFYDLMLPRPPFNAATAPWTVSNGIEALPGFFLSSRAPLNGRLLLNVNTTTSAFYEPGNLGALITSLGTNNLHALQRDLMHIRVETAYLSQSSQHLGNGPRDEMRHSITGLPSTALRPTAGNTMITVNGIQQTIHQFFVARHPGVPVAANETVVSFGRSIIPGRLLTVLDGTFVKKKTEMVRHAARLPNINRALINSQGKTLFALTPQDADGPGALFGGIDIAQNMLRISANILKSPTFGYMDRGNPSQSRPVLPASAQKGSWDMRHSRFAQPALSGSWSFVELTRPNSRDIHPDALARWFDKVSQELRAYGITSRGVRYQPVQPQQNQRHPGNQGNAGHHGNFGNFGNFGGGRGLPGGRGPRGGRGGPIYINTNPQQAQSQYEELRQHKLAITGSDTTNEQNLVGRFRQLERDLNATQRLDLIFVLLPARETHTYAMVKRAGDQTHGVPTICHVCEHGGPQTTLGFIGNLAMKFNLKMSPRGVNQKLINGTSVLTRDTMLMGLDVTHAGPGALDGAPSVAAIVGSIEPDFAQFPATLRANPRAAPTGNHSIGLSNEEIMPLADMVATRLRHYVRVRGSFPHKLIVYRDGLSEQQFDMCQTRELPRIREGIQHVIDDPANANSNFQIPSIMLICTVKRHHTRFFQDGDNTDLVDHKGNPVPGVLVDTDVTLGAGNDFFLYSHSALQGTSKPTHYVILENEMNEPTLNIANMTHALCHLYQRATKSVSLAPPSYYADLAAERARCYARNVFAPQGHGVFVQGAPAGHASHLNLNVNPLMVDNMFYI